MTRQTAPTRSRFSSRSGFALLITITLLSFLILLLVSLSTLTRVETQIAGNSQQLQQARQNALLALNIALGQLQKYAGPDNRITARGDITSAAAQQPYLTGVWDSSGGITSSNATAMTYLVSGNEVAPLSIKPSDNDPSIPKGDGISLVGAGTASPKEHVTAKKMKITAPAGSVPGLAAGATPTIGQYAWWISDEGIKASATMVDQTFANAASNPPKVMPNDNWSGGQPLTARQVQQLGQIMQPRPLVENILTTPVAPDTTDLTSLTKISDYNQLRLLPSGPNKAMLKTAYHDLTVLSRGVLVNTDTGNLRTDFTPANTAKNTDFKTKTASKVDFKAMDDYIMLRPDKPATTTDPYISIFYPKVSKWIPPATGAASPTQWPVDGIYPTLHKEFGMRFDFTITKATKTKPSKINLTYYLDFQLWNPYAATIQIASGQKLKFTFTLPNDIDFTVTPKDNTQTPVKYTLKKASYIGEWVPSSKGDTDMAPGAYFHIKGAAVLTHVTSGSSSSDTFPAVDLGTTDITAIDKVSAKGPGGNQTGNLEATLELNGTQLVKRLNKQIINFTDQKSTIGIGVSVKKPNINFEVHSTPQATSEFDPRYPALKTDDYALAQTAGSAGWAPTIAQNPVPTIVYDLPRQEFVSVAQFRHLAGPVPETISNATPTVAMPLGNSWGGSLNSLFDSAFFSTVPLTVAWPVDGSQPRANRYLDIYIPPAGVPAATLADLRDPIKSARYQLIRGAFNINSTSVAAWNAILSSPTIVGWSWQGATNPTTLQNAFYRMPMGAQELLSPPSKTTPPVSLIPQTPGNSDTDTVAGRQLKVTEVSDLADQIVTKLKARKRPFGSLAEFANSGLIESAIAATNINSLLSTWAGDPLYLTQADVLAKIAPFMAARSDTFVIRAYGETVNPLDGTTITGTAYCEATVQRVPELVSNPTAAAATVAKPGVTPGAAGDFGRRFQIISFRWLSDDDI